MKKIIFILFIFNLSLFSQTIVYKADISKEIDLGLAPYIKRVIKEAEQNKANYIIFNINTFGGRVDAATQIKDAILDSKVKTVAFINKRAISAGALIALSCDKIIMVNGASIGASTVVNETGQKVSEKYQSYMRAEMRSTAEKTGRRTDIAQAMVDERIIISDLADDSTTLVTLTSEEAIKVGFADTILANSSQILEYLNIPNASIVTNESNWAEDFVRFLNNPIISSLLIMIGLVGFFTEIKTPGWGLPGTAAIIALALFFGSGYILDLATGFEILLFIIGVILIIAEIFFIPGFGIFGILGIVFVVGSLFLGLIGDLPTVDGSLLSAAIIQLGATFVFTGIIIAILIKYLPKTTMMNNLILHDSIDAKVDYTATLPDNSHLINKEGICLTDLRPSGTVIIEDKRYDVVADNEYITHNSTIKVVRVEGMRIVVAVKK
ncbi:MAG TPA: NfeD family protein [Melioribacteraceae bacterium]|nr:NfeD family protein [Melioribacteraceae bacterium]